MENVEERINNLKEELIKLDASLQVKYNELEKEGASHLEKSIVDDYSFKIRKLFVDLVESNVEETEDKLIELEKEITRVYGDELVKSIYIKPVVIKNEEPEEKKDKHNLYVAGLASGAILTGLVGYAVMNGNNKTNQAAVINSRDLETVSETETNTNGLVDGNQETIVIAVEDTPEPTVAPTVAPTPVPTVVPTPVPTPVPTVAPTPEPTPEVTIAPVEEVVTLVLGEPGTFLDVTDEEQVMARAQYIYDNYYAGFVDKLSADERAHVTVERIANTIRVVNGNCPLDENGYKMLDANTTDTYSQAFVDLTANIPSSDVMGTVEMVPTHLFAVDGSETQEFLKSYDELYARIAEGRNNRNSDEYRAAGKIIAAKMWCEWFCQGMGGNILYNTQTGEIDYDNNVRFNESTGNWEYVCPENGNVEVLYNTEVYPVTNPHNIDATYRYFAYMGSMYRYGSFIKEAEFNQMATICIPACINYSTKEMEELSIAQIYTAIDEGIWNDVIARSAGMSGRTEPFCVGFWEALNDQLEFDYTHSNTLKLN